MFCIMAKLKRKMYRNQWHETIIIKYYWLIFTPAKFNPPSMFWAFLHLFSGFYKKVICILIPCKKCYLKPSDGIGRFKFQEDPGCFSKTIESIMLILGILLVISNMIETWIYFKIKEYLESNPIFSSMYLYKNPKNC